MSHPVAYYPVTSSSSSSTSSSSTVMPSFWGSSWSTSEINGSTNSDALKPSLAQILTSKRIRYTASALAVIALFFLTFRNYDHIPSLTTIRGGTSGSSIVGGGVNKDCPPAVVPSFDESSIDWSQYAYTQYVTNKDYLCNSVMIFESLHRLKAKADRVIMYPESMMSPTETEPQSNEAKLLVKARDEYNVKLVPVSVQSRPGGDRMSRNMRIIP